MNDAREGENDPSEYDFYSLSITGQEGKRLPADNLRARSVLAHSGVQGMCGTFAQSRSASDSADARCSVAYATANDSLTGVVLRKTFLVMRESL
jgi:hypothetical protein